MEGQFVTVVPGRFAFIAPESGDDNLFVSGAALAGLSDIPRRGDRVRFKVMTMKDGRRRAVDIVLFVSENTQGTKQ